MTTITAVPNEILWDIFMFLKGLEINKDKEICRRWHDIIESGDMFLPRQHLEHNWVSVRISFTKGVYYGNKNLLDDLKQFRRCYFRSLNLSAINRENDAAEFIKVIIFVDEIKKMSF